MKRNFRMVTFLLLIATLLTGCSQEGLVSSKETETNTATLTAETAPDSNPTTEEERKTGAKDGVIRNILMIGNSFCYYYVEELYGIAKADGYELTVANLYESGCYVKEHFLWQNTNAANYQFFITDSKGRNKTSIQTINGALDYMDWDVITLQQHFSPGVADSYSECLASCTPYVKNLYNLFKKDHPYARLYWHQTWAYEAGYDRNGVQVDTARQSTNYENIKKASQFLCQQNEVSIIPSGDAWQLARAMAEVGDGLCARLSATNGNDKYHDGDVGGGQYLNACVWYEVLMKESCIGNTWRPSYDLSEAKILALQKAAHQAVAAVYGEDWAK